MSYNNYNYTFPFWGPLLLKTTISNECYNFIDSVVKDSLENKYPFSHGIVKMKDEYEFSPENKEIFEVHLQELLQLYYSVYRKEWWPHSSDFVEKFVLKNAWVNWQGKNEFRSPHIHDKCDMSFVIYYDIPDELVKEASEETQVPIKPGAIVFKDKVGDSDNPIKSIAEYAHFPSTGECFIFPAYLFHYTIPFKSDCTRISISGNVDVITND